MPGLVEKPTPQAPQLGHPQKQFISDSIGTTGFQDNLQNHLNSTSSTCSYRRSPVPESPDEAESNLAKIDHLQSGFQAILGT